MESIVTITVRLIRAAQKAYARKWSFLLIFVILFVGSVVALAQLDLLPDPSTQGVSANPLIGEGTSTAQLVVSPELPMKIEIPKINLSTIISNPTTTDIDALDAELLKGAVRYPTSAKLGVDGNVVLFGHSSYLPIVKNQAYKTFNGIQKLATGDVITVYSSGTAYTYTVRSVAKESAATDAGIPLDVTGKVLTLSTCDSFGVKTDRFVVTADFVDSHSIST